MKWIFPFITWIYFEPINILDCDLRVSKKLLYILSTDRSLHLISKMIKDLMPKKIIQKKIIEESMVRVLQRT